LQAGLREDLVHSARRFTNGNAWDPLDPDFVEQDFDFIEDFPAQFVIEVSS
jgi:hypothetical protein